MVKVISLPYIFQVFLCFVPRYQAKISGERLQDHWSSGLVFLLYHACITEQILTPRMKSLCSKTRLQDIYYNSHNLLFKLPQIATFIAHKNEHRHSGMYHMHVWQSYSVSLRGRRSQMLFV